MNARISFVSRLIWFGLLVQAPALVIADTSENDQRPGPPQAAIDACAALTAGDNCSFVLQEDKEISGTCFAPPQRVLACRPSHFKAGAAKHPQGEDAQGAATEE